MRPWKDACGRLPADEGGRSRRTASPGLVLGTPPGHAHATAEALALAELEGIAPRPRGGKRLAGGWKREIMVEHRLAAGVGQGYMGNPG